MAEQGTFIVKVRRRDGQWKSLPSYAFRFGGVHARLGGEEGNATREQARAKADQAVDRLKAANRDLEYGIDEFDSNDRPVTSSTPRQTGESGRA